jgi:hypothetical protein
MTGHAMPGVPLDLPLPPEVDRAWGYPADARYVLIFGDGDHVTCTDGRDTRIGNAHVFNLYCHHRAVEPLLRGFDLHGHHCLVFDREVNRVSIATGPESAAFLLRHRPPLPPSQRMTGGPGSLVEQITTGWREEKVDQEAVRRAMDEQRGRVGRMMSWLDMAPTPPPREGRGA